MKVVERVLEKGFIEYCLFDEMQFGFMPERGTIDAVFMFIRMHEDIMLRKIFYLCILWT